MLRISEMFHSIQGEGKSSGVPAIFLRTQHCNLLCKWPCDTIAVWQNGKPYTTKKLLQMWTEKGWLELLHKKKAHIIITGGEPLLQQDGLIEFLQTIGTDMFVEVETNGTIQPTTELDTYITQYNVSPKLQNSQISQQKRYLPTVLEWFARNEKSNFKFVVQNEKDVQEIIIEFVDPFQISSENIYLMPISNNQKELIENSDSIVRQCKHYGFNYSTRLQLVIWDKKTGI